MLKEVEKPGKLANDLNIETMAVFLKINNLDSIVLSTNSIELHQQIFDGLLPTTSSNNVDYWEMDHGPGISLESGSKTNPLLSLKYQASVIRLLTAFS